MFVYEVTRFLEDGKKVRIKYKKQVIEEGGDRFRVYEDSEGDQVCSVRRLVYFFSAFSNLFPCFSSLI